MINLEFLVNKNNFNNTYLIVEYSANYHQWEDYLINHVKLHSVIKLDKNMEEKMKMVLDLCVCSNCPSWVDCGEKGGFCFPSIGKSQCIVEEKGCICGECPVTEKKGLKHMYYCTRGSEMEQSG